LRRRLEQKNRKRPIHHAATGSFARRFCDSGLARQRAALAMSPAQSAKLNRQHPLAGLRNVPERLSSHPNSRIDELLAHRWMNPDA
jgi:transposase